MTLLELRTQFIKQNGRFDLVVDTTDYEDDGADYYINAGVRYLDNHAMNPKSYAWYKYDFVVNDHRILVPGLLSAKEVWMVNSADDRRQLTKQSLGYMKDYYSDYSIAVSNSGTPTDWCMAVARLAPEQSDRTSLNYEDHFTYGWEDIIFTDDGPHYSYRLVWWMPKADTAGTVEILGRFKANTLSVDGDINFWTSEYPEVLIEAANLALEATYRNTAGMQDRENYINQLLLGIDHTLVEEEISGVNQMSEG